MALIQCDFFSDILGLCMSMNVILPQNTQRQIGLEGKAKDGKHPVLFLLHGMSDDHSIWLRRTSIERYVSQLGLAVVMPAVHKSRYANLSTGDRYWDYISQEVPSLARSFFNLSDKREDTFVAGLSMGGFGAMKLGLNYPEQFAAAASLSGALTCNWDVDSSKLRGMELAFGSEEEYKGSINDLRHVATTLNQSQKPKPKLYQACGSEDFLIQNNHDFKDCIETLDFDFTYEEEPGTHDWAYWDKKIQSVLAWLPLSS